MHIAQVGVSKVCICIQTFLGKVHEFGTTINDSTNKHYPITPAER